MGITINLNKAKEITKDKLRIEREEEFKKLDVSFQRALETGADTSTIVSEKQRLRDITKLVDQATTVDQLKNIKI